VRAGWAARAGMPSLLLAVSLAAACGGGNREREGDQAYADGRYAEALAGYRTLLAGRPTAALWAKVGAAALHANELREAAEAYLRLAGDDPTRADEAAEGLEAVARAAERAGNGDVLREVVTGLQAVAPERATGRYALVLALQPDPDTAELVALLPAALAAATAPETVDSLLALYGRALEATGGCGQALLQYRAVLRRSQDSSMRAPARRGAADCAYALGARADSARKLEDAALWYAESARMDSSTPTGRRALLRYAADRLVQGDTLAAALAFQTVASGGTVDSMGQAAAARLSALGLFPLTGDSARTGAR
jgi:tetratricopeptide (TPR) repeat protein